MLKQKLRQKKSRCSRSIECFHHFDTPKRVTLNRPKHRGGMLPQLVYISIMHPTLVYKTDNFLDWLVKWGNCQMSRDCSGGFRRAVGEQDPLMCHMAHHRSIDGPQGEERCKKSSKRYCADKVSRQLYKSGFATGRKQ